MATNKLVQRKKERFLELYKEHASISHAAKAAKISRMDHYRWKAEDEEYARLFDEAQEIAADAIDDEIVRRAKEGTLKPVYQGGKLVGKIREYSDTLLIFYAKAIRPAKYRDKFIVIPAKQSDGKTPEGVVWVGSDESSTDSAGQAKANNGFTN